MVSLDPNEIGQSLDAPLVVVMPVYNEETSIARVIREWLELLRNVGALFHIVALDDGSCDQTRDILLRLQAEQPDVLRVVSKSNSGHGMTCRAGYEIAVCSRADWVLQIDSDGQCDPRHFAEFWKRREEYDCIFGVRASRDDGVVRVIISRLCRLVSSLICGQDLKDPNVPYRLMRREVLQEALPNIPAEFYIQNVALTCVLRKLPGLRWNYVNIHFRGRQGGKPSAGILKILRWGGGMLFGLMRIRVRTPGQGFSTRRSILPAGNTPR
jgi:glycosyltransferase involved in cell wall biosynthesis